MYAVVETGGKQYRVAVGDKLKVEKIAAEEGESINLGRVLMVADGENVTVGSPDLDTPVTATVVSQGKAGKIKVFKMKRRKNYRRTQGHRQDYTEIEITGIGGKSAAAKPKKAAEKSAETKPVESDSPAKSDGDDLTQIAGVGPVIAEKLAGLGINTFKQIADLDEAGIENINEQLNFKGRIEREEWIEQAKKLVG